LNVIYECDKGCGAFWIRQFGPKKSALTSYYTMEIVDKFIYFVSVCPKLSIRRIRDLLTHHFGVKIAYSTAYLWWEDFATKQQKRDRNKYREI